MYLKLSFLVIFIFSEYSSAIDYPGVTNNFKISSEHLKYDIHYRVFLPENYQQLENLPVIYFTDGSGYLFHLRTADVLQRLINEKRIQPVIGVFVDSQVADKIRGAEANYEFFCNPRYADFYSNELIPKIDAEYPTSKKASDRVIMGLSFGGLNSACFGLMLSDWFEGVGMLSPDLHPVEKIFDYYQNNEKLPLNFFLSTGTIGDNEGQTRKLRNILRKKGYTLKYKEVRNGRHDWEFWRPLVDDFLLYFFSQTDS